MKPFDTASNDYLRLLCEFVAASPFRSPRTHCHYRWAEAPLDAAHQEAEHE